jgi:transcriptional regulator with XRE-family HTH domain
MAEVERKIDVERYRQMFKEAESHSDYWIDGPISEFTEDLSRLMKEQGVNRAELARRMGTSRAYITKMLGGNANFTLLTMVKLAMALEGAVHIHIADKRAITRWQDTLPGEGGKKVRKRARKPHRPAAEPEQKGR